MADGGTVTKSRSMDKFSCLIRSRIYGKIRASQTRTETINSEKMELPEAPLKMEPPEAPFEPPPAGELFIITGPAGSGKSTLCDRVPVEIPGFARFVTMTSRLPREGEIDGIHYDFVEPETFEANIRTGKMLEYALVHQQSSDTRKRYYGVTRTLLERLARGERLIMNIEVQGVQTFRALAVQYPILRRAMTTVFIRVDRARLIARLRTRRQDSEDEIERRMITAQKELLEAPKFNFIIDSRTPDEDFRSFCDIIEVARCRKQLSGCV